MSGTLKHFFDGIYCPCLAATKRRPYGLYVRQAACWELGALVAAEVAG